MEYTPEQIKDITGREAKALDALKELQLSPAAMPQMVNLGGDVFGIKIIPYLRDLKFTPQESPIQKQDI